MSKEHSEVLQKTTPCVVCGILCCVIHDASSATGSWSSAGACRVQSLLSQFPELTRHLPMDPGAQQAPAEYRVFCPSFQNWTDEFGQNKMVRVQFRCAVWSWPEY